MLTVGFGILRRCRAIQCLGRDRKDYVRRRRDGVSGREGDAESSPNFTKIGEEEGER